MTVIRDPTWRGKLARGYRMTRKAERERKRERERREAEYAACEARQPEVIKRTEIERGQDDPS